MELLVVSLGGSAVLLLVQWCVALVRDWRILCGDWYGLYHDWHCAKLCESLNLQASGAPTQGWRSVTPITRCKVTSTPCSQRAVHCFDCHWALLKDPGSQSPQLECYWATGDHDVPSQLRKAS